MGLAAGVGILGRAFKHLGKLKGVGKHFSDKLRPVVNKSVTAIVPYSKTAYKAPYSSMPQTIGALHPLSLLASGAKVAAPVATIGTAAYVGIGGIKAVGDYIDPTQIGEDKVGDLGSKGVKFKDGYSNLDEARLRLGQLVRGNWGNAFTGADSELQNKVLGAARGVRNENFHNEYADNIDKNKAGLGRFKAGIDRGQDFTGMTEQQILQAIGEDEQRVLGITNLQNVERGSEKLSTLSPNASAGDLRGALTSTHVENRDIAQGKIDKKEADARRREDDSLRIERERADANTRLQLILGNQTVRRQEEADERARKDRMYYDNLDRQERRSQRRATRIRDERQAQREMIGMLLGGLDNLGS